MASFLVRASAGQNGAAPAVLVAASAILARLLFHVVVSAPVRGGKPPCGGAPSGEANLSQTKGELGEPPVSGILEQPTTGATVAARGGPEGSRPKTRTLADPLFGGGVAFPSCINAH